MTEKPREEFMEAAAIISMEWIDITPVAEALAEQYEKGFKAGVAAVSIDQDVLRAEYQRGMDDCRDMLLARISEAKKDGPPRVAPPEPPKVDPPKQVRPDRQAPHPRVGARRPEGIPTTFTMVQIVLKETAVKLTARGVMAEIEKRWWPDLGPSFLGPDISSFITMGRLARDADGTLSLTDKGATMVSADLRHGTKGEFQEPKPTVPEAVKAIVEEKPKLPVVRVEPKKLVAPQPVPRSPGQPVKFDHGDKTTYLATTREFVIASKLRNAMGKGHVGEAYLASEVLGSNTVSNRDVIKLACRGMNESLAAVGLKIEHFEGYGLLMQEVG